MSTKLREAFHNAALTRAVSIDHNVAQWLKSSTACLNQIPYERKVIWKCRKALGDDHFAYCLDSFANHKFVVTAAELPMNPSNDTVAVPGEILDIALTDGNLSSLPHSGLLYSADECSLPQELPATHDDLLAMSAVNSNCFSASSEVQEAWLEVQATEGGGDWTVPDCNYQGSSEPVSQMSTTDDEHYDAVLPPKESHFDHVLDRSHCSLAVAKPLETIATRAAQRLYEELEFTFGIICQFIQDVNVAISALQNYHARTLSGKTYRNVPPYSTAHVNQGRLTEKKIRNWLIEYENFARNDSPSTQLNATNFSNALQLGGIVLDWGENSRDFRLDLCGTDTTHVTHSYIDWPPHNVVQSKKSDRSVLLPSQPHCPLPKIVTLESPDVRKTALLLVFEENWHEIDNSPTFGILRNKRRRTKHTRMANQFSHMGINHLPSLANGEDDLLCELGSAPCELGIISHPLSSTPHELGTFHDEVVAISHELTVLQHELPAMPPEMAGYNHLVDF